MLGRTYAKSGDFARAVQAFQLTRTLVTQAHEDPLGLAVASFGEEAQRHLQRARADLSGPKGTLAPDKSSDYGNEMAAVVKLHAEQTTYGSQSGRESLREVAEELLQPDSQVLDNRLQAVIADPIAQRLLVAYALAALEDTGFVRVQSKTGVEYDQPSPNDALVRLAKAVASLPVHSVDSPIDRLAALEYHAGDYSSAGEFADKIASPLSSWVKAKLALQRSDLTAAAKEYAEAASAFPNVGNRQAVVRDDLDEDNKTLLIGETGVLQLARGDYVQALQVLYPLASTYWGDVAYIAERVPTTDELKSFVDNQVDARNGWSAVGNVFLSYGAAGNKSARRLTRTPDSDEDMTAALRDLLARRLMRDGRYSEALNYFHSPGEGRFSDQNAREEAAEYASACI